MKDVRKFVLLLLVSLSLSTPALAAYDYYLRLDGIPGDATEVRHRDWISITSYSFGASATTGSSGSGSSSFDVDVSDFSFTKLLDSASPKIFEHLVLGKHIPKAQLDIVETGAKSGTVFSYSFEDVLFTSVTHSGGAPGLPIESASFRFDVVTLETLGTDPKGGGKPVIFKYDVKQAAAVPEPSSWAMLALGLVTVGFVMKRARGRFGR